MNVRTVTPVPWLGGAESGAVFIGGPASPECWYAPDSRAGRGLPHNGPEGGVAILHKHHWAAARGAA